MDNLVKAGKAPQALSTLVDTVIKDFFTRPLLWNVIPWPGNGSIFYYAPPIWVEDHFNDCVTGSSDTITPAGNVDPVTNKAQLVDNSYMPDLYLAIGGQYVDKYGNPNGGAPVQTGDWPDFAASPLTVYPGNTPWNACYIGPLPSASADGRRVRNPRVSCPCRCNRPDLDRLISQWRASLTGIGGAGADYVDDRLAGRMAVDQAGEVLVGPDRTRILRRAGGRQQRRPGSAAESAVQFAAPPFDAADGGGSVWFSICWHFPVVRVELPGRGSGGGSGLGREAELGGPRGG